MATGPAFSPEQFKLLMDSAAGWADSWDDVLWYLKGPAAADTHLPDDVVRSVETAVQDAKRSGVPYARDYRPLWERIAGIPAEELPAPEVRDSPTDPIELKETYLAGLTFPADGPAVYRYAEDHGAPWRVLNALSRIAKRVYSDMDDVLDAVGDVAWNPRRAGVGRP